MQMARKNLNEGKTASELVFLAGFQAGVTGDAVRAYPGFGGNSPVGTVSVGPVLWGQGDGLLLGCLLGQRSEPQALPQLPP